MKPGLTLAITCLALTTARLQHQQLVTGVVSGYSTQPDATCANAELLPEK